MNNDNTSYTDGEKNTDTVIKKPIAIPPLGVMVACISAGCVVNSKIDYPNNIIPYVFLCAAFIYAAIGFLETFKPTKWDFLIIVIAIISGFWLSSKSENKPILSQQGTQVSTQKAPEPSSQTVSVEAPAPAPRSYNPPPKKQRKIKRPKSPRQKKAPMDNQFFSNRESTTPPTKNEKPEPRPISPKEDPHLP